MKWVFHKKKLDTIDTFTEIHILSLNKSLRPVFAGLDLAEFERTDGIREFDSNIIYFFGKFYFVLLVGENFS